MIKKEFERSADLAYLRSESLQPVLFGIMAALYLWYLVLFQPINQVGAAGWGLVLLGGGLAVAFLARKRNVSFASAALILSIAAAILYTMWLTDTTAAPYLLAVAVSLTGLLFSLKAVMGVTVLCSSAVMAYGFPVLGTFTLLQRITSAGVGDCARGNFVLAHCSQPVSYALLGLGSSHGCPAQRGKTTRSSGGAGSGSKSPRHSLQAIRTSKLRFSPGTRGCRRGQAEPNNNLPPMLATNYGPP